jgi:anti-sigma regulatory factor (Ser/Thr protein kinase)
MILCVACCDAVEAGGRCPTCGELDAGRGGSGSGASLDEALLDRVDVALAAQAALARRTATQRVESAARLFAETVVLTGRLRRQAALLRARIAERQELVPDLRDALDHVQDALERADRSARRGRAWSLSARLPRDSSCPRVARGLLEEYAREEMADREREDAMVITSELATNAFLHGDGAIVLNVDRDGDRLRIAVLDEGHPEHIGVVPENERHHGGRGLWIIEQLASDWGVVAGAGHVWAELPLGPR